MEPDVCRVAVPTCSAGLPAQSDAQMCVQVVGLREQHHLHADRLCSELRQVLFRDAESLVLHLVAFQCLSFVRRTVVSVPKLNGSRFSLFSLPLDINCQVSPIVRIDFSSLCDRLGNLVFRTHTLHSPSTKVIDYYSGEKMLR